MNNQELELKVKEILAIENFFDMMEAAIAFEKEYKGTNFFKKTKMPLVEVIKNSKTWYTFQLKGIGEHIQGLIDGLDFTNVNDIINNLGTTYAQENHEIMDIIKEFQKIVK